MARRLAVFFYAHVAQIALKLGYLTSTTAQGQIQSAVQEHQLQQLLRAFDLAGTSKGFEVIGHLPAIFRQGLKKSVKTGIQCVERQLRVHG